MEPVPESERMEEFRSAPPLPTVSLQSSPSFTFASPTPLSPRKTADPDGYLRKPAAIRRMNEPSSPVSPSWTTANALPYRPRTASPLSGYHSSSHVRSRSTASPGGLLPPSMARTRSMPGVTGSGHFQFETRSSSPGRPQRPPAITTRTPKKAILEDVFPSSPTRVSVLNDSDRRQLHERNSSPNLKTETSNTSNPGSSPTPAIAMPMAVATFPLVRTRRPSSPYRRLASAGSTSSSSSSNVSASPVSSSSASFVSSSSSSSLSSVTLSPTLKPISDVTVGANDSATTGTETSSSNSTSFTASSPSYRPLEGPVSNSYGAGSSLSASSVPSTPTSTRSRSPSISSLETIPDSPDAEEAALEADRIAQLKADADAAEGGDAKGRSSLDVPTRGRTMGFGSRDKRKRWSVCGAERRGDLDLETIWED